MNREFLPITLLKEFVWCPRIAYLKYYTLPEPATESMLFPNYSRVELLSILRNAGIEGDIVMELPVESKSLRLSGRIDAVAIAPSEATPIEIKLYTSRKSIYSKSRHHLVQIAAYSIALEETLRKPVYKAVVVSLTNRRVFTIAITPRLRENVRRLAIELHKYIENEILPPPTPTKTRCTPCFYRKICGTTPIHA